MTTRDPTAVMEDVEHSLQALRRMVQALALVLIVLSASLNVFLAFQVSNVRSQLAQRRGILEQYDTRGEEVMEEFLKDLRQYAERDPGFAPIVERHFPAALEKAATVSTVESSDDSP
jgi:hypothetical protein